MIIYVSLHRPFLRVVLFSTRCVLKGQPRPSKRRTQVHLQLKQLEISARVNKAKKLPSQEVVIFQPKTVVSPKREKLSSGVNNSKKALPPAFSLKIPFKTTTPVQVTENQLKAPKRRFGRFRPASILFILFVISSILLLLGLFGPAVYYTVFPGDPVPLTTTETGTPLGGRFDAGTQQRKVALPPYDETLPDGTWVVIPRIGVRSQIQENQNSEVALEKGIWRVPDFGVPGDLSKPMILAAHRYGYIWWWKNGSQYWRYNSFYLLPDLKQGDLVEVISDKRKYVYEVYSGEEGTEINDYNADLILYTCKFLTGEARFFRYARLVDPSKDTQKS